MKKKTKSLERSKKEIDCLLKFAHGEMTFAEMRKELEGNDKDEEV